MPVPNTIDKSNFRENLKTHDGIDDFAVLVVFLVARQKIIETSKMVSIKMNLKAIFNFFAVFDVTGSEHSFHCRKRDHKLENFTFYTAKFLKSFDF